MLLSPSLSFAANASSTTAEKTYIAWDEVACTNPQSASCYRETFCNVLAKSDPAFAEPQNQKECINKNYILREVFHGYSVYDLSAAKTPTVFVTVHGLWMNAEQLHWMVDANSKLPGNEFNSIHLTLPGHVKMAADAKYLESVKQNRPFADYKEWLAAVEGTLKLARHLGEKTVFIGESVGGLLGVAAALQHPELIDELVLIEPALKVRGYANTAACLSGPAADSFVDGLTQMISKYSHPNGQLIMGCEVQKLADQIFPIEPRHRERNPKDWLRPVSEMDVYREVAARIRTPVLFINNVNDLVVSTEANRYFYSGLRSPKIYFPINEDGQLFHGRVGVASGLIADLIAEAMHKHHPFSPFARYHMYRTGNLLISQSNWPCDGFKELPNCEKFLPIQLIRTNHLKKVICELFDNKETCEKSKSALESMERFWKTQLEYARKNGLAATAQKFTTETYSFSPALSPIAPEATYLRDLAIQLRSHY